MLAGLRGHHVFDGAVLAGRIHSLKNEQYRPAILRIKNVLQLCERLNPGRQHFLARDFSS